MRLFSEEVKITSSNSPLNILQVKDFQEVFFGVFEVQINENKYVAEKISEENGNPIVSIIVENGDSRAQYPFLLLKGKQEIYFNSESEPVEIFESNIENEENEDLEVKDLIEENFDNSEIIEDKKQEILEEIKRVKRNAVKKSLEILEHNKAKNIQDIKNESRKKEKALKGYLESARENLVSEFTIISGKIKNELILDNDYRFDEIRESIDLKIQDIADNLNESLGKNFQNSSKLIDKSVKQLVKELYESNINPKVDKELKDIAEEIVEKVSEIDKNLNNKLDEKADVSLIEGVNRELDAIRDANIELNNSLNKGVQKALSRVGNVDKRILEISEKFDKKISETEQEITQYFDEKLSLVKEETLDITDEARKYFHNLIQESRNGLLSEIRKIKNEKPIEYILESKTGKPIVKDWDSIEKDWNKKIHDKFENYKTDLRKYVAVYASGGGTNATQYQDGGTMNGNLTVTGAISASNYLGLVIPNPDLSKYLPLSGGTVTGDLTVVGKISATSNITTSGNISASNYNPGANVAAFLQTPTSDNLRAALTDDTGTGANVFADNSTISSPTINTALTLNATTYAYGVSAREGLLNSLSNRFVYKDGLIPFAEIFDDFPTTIDSRFGTHRWISNSGTVAYYNAGGPTVANYWGAISLTTGTTLNNTANIYLAPTGGANGQTASRSNISFQTCFCASVSSCEYKQTLQGGGGSYAITVIFNTGVIQLESPNIGGTGINTLTVASGLSLSTGNFVSGTRYRLFYKPLSLTQCEVYFASSPWNSSTWTTLVDTTVTHPSVASTAVCTQPFVTVTTKLNPGSAVAYLDWVAIRQEIQR
jgi:hypothetical protein